MLHFKKKFLKASLSICSLLALSTCLQCIAQEQEYPNDDPEAARKKEAEKMFKQSKMSVQELIKNGIIEDAKSGGDTGDYQAPTQEEMALQALGSQGKRQAVPMTPFAQDAAFSAEGAGYKSNSAYTPGGDPSQPRWSAPPRGILTQDQYQSRYMMPKDSPSPSAPNVVQPSARPTLTDPALPAVPVPQKNLSQSNTAPESSEPVKASDGF